MDGVLIYDWLNAGPSAWVDPVGFATRQYAHYPTLGIGSTYPPGFAVIEAGFFAVFGVSVVTSRLCVLAFALLAVGGLFSLVRRFTNAIVAACAVLALLAMPSIVLWSRQTMLEAPTLAVLIWSAIAACAYHDRPSWGRLALWVLLCVAAVMFKQTAAFIFLPHAILILTWAIRRQAPWRHAVAAAIGSSGAVGTYFLLISSHGEAGPLVLDVILKGHTASEIFTAKNWLTYAQWLPDQASGWVLVLGALGLVITLRRPNLLTAIMLLWFIIYYAQASFVQHKEPRYFFFGLLPITVWAGTAVGFAITRLRSSRVRVPAVAALTLIVSVVGFQRPIPYRPNYGPLVLAHRDQIVGKLVLFDGLRDSDFTFAVRQHLGPRKCVIVRASKLFYTCATLPQFRFESYVQSVDQVDAILRNFAFDSVFIERHPKMNLAEEQMLRASLSKSDDYALAASHTLRTGSGIAPTSVTQVDMDVYLPRRPMERHITRYQIPMPTDPRDIIVDFGELLAEDADPS